MTTDMRIGGLTGFAPITDSPVKKTKTFDSGKVFEDIFTAAMDVVKETNAFQLTADRLQTDFATGKTDDMVAVLLAQDKAFSSLNFTVQITNKIIESYREIMRMQI